MPHLHIHASGEANSEANDERTNHIFASSFVASFASPFVALNLQVVFPTLVKEDDHFIHIMYTNMWMSVRMWKQFIRIETKAYKCFVQVARRGTRTNM